MGAIITPTDAPRRDLVDLAGLPGRGDLSDPVGTVPSVLLGPERCVLCGTVGPPVCATCLRRDAAPALVAPLHVDACCALLDYHRARPLVTGLKNGQRRALIGPLADALASRAVAPSGAVVTWAPTTPERARRRGFDQAELLARALSRRWRLPARALLDRKRGTAQAGRRADDRRATPVFRPVLPVPPVVVLVDDVVTTGATLTAAARALRGGGAAQVVAVALAQAGHRLP
jgi:predicted amidophosphoribosyltransferase